MTRLPRASVLTCLLLGGLLAMLPVSGAHGQTLDDVLRYSDPFPAAGANTGMAGAGLSAGRDAPAALFGNPAGLGWISASVLGGDFAIQRSRTDTRFATPDATAFGDRAVSDYRLGSLSGAYSFPTAQGAFVLAAAYHQTDTYGRGLDVRGENRSNSISRTLLPSGFEVFDDGTIEFNTVRSRIAFEAGATDFSRDVFENGNYPFFQAANPNAPAVDGAMTLEQQDDVREFGQMNEVSVGGAAAIAPDVMLGAGLNIAFGSYTYERFFRETETSGLLPPEDPQNPQRPYDPYFLLETTLEGSETILEGFQELRIEERIEAELTGVSVRTGLSAQPIDALRVGLHLESPTWFSVDEVFGTAMETTLDCDFSRSGTSCPVGGVPGFESGSLTANEFEYDLRTPWRIGAGLQFHIADLTIAGDVEFVDWTTAEVDAGNTGSEDIDRAIESIVVALNRQIRELDPTFNTRAGAAYETDLFGLRVGAAYRPSPLTNDAVAPLRRPPAQIGRQLYSTVPDRSQLFLSAGASVALSDKATLNINWLQERSEDQFVPYALETGTAPVVQEDLRRNRVTLGLTYWP